jgi:hypothetical protein
MMGFLGKSDCVSCPRSRGRTTRPALELLEGRLLLYATLGAQWVYGSRITYSFVPDGTSVGGTPSVLFQTLNAKFPTATWQQQFQKAAAVWQAVANVNLAQVPDDGSPIGVNGNQQDDPRFGDIRFSAIPQSSGTLASCFLPPPINGGSDAGDISLNSTVNWQINSSYDIETVAIHEIGHALGMGHSLITTACMYAFYNGQKQALTGDDTAGIQSIYGAPQYDQFNSGGQSNGTYGKAVNVTPYIDSNAQVAIGNLDITTGSQAEWFYVTAPSSTTGTMVATVQSSALSSLNPKVTVFTSSLKPLGMVGSSNYGDTVSFSVSGVVPGQGYYIRASNNGGSSNGAFGLELNFGSMPQPPIPPPNTVVLQQSDQGGGGIQGPVQLPPQASDTATTAINRARGLITLGTLTDWGEALTVQQLTNFTGTPVVTPAPLPPGAWAPPNPDAQFGTLDGAALQGPSFAGDGSIGAVIASPNGLSVPTGSNYLVNQSVDRALDSWSQWA